MSQHDTWVRLKPQHPFTSIEYLFPQGLPMRDPFPMGRSADGKVALWFIDDDRLEADQSQAIAKLYAQKFGVTTQEVIADAIPDGFAIDANWVKGMYGGAECYRRSLEAADFFAAHPRPDAQAYEQFIKQQYRDWIEGDRTPEPMPERYEDIDPRFKNPGLEEIYRQIEVNKALQGYSVMDVLTGKATLDVLNQNEYSLASKKD